MTTCNPYCPPLIIFLILSFIGYVSMFNKAENKTTYSMNAALSALLWGYILYVLCKNCHNTLAWLLVFAPFILMGALVVLLIWTYPDKKGKKD